MRDILLLGIVGVSFLIALRQPVYGILFFVWLGIFNPHSMTWSIAQRLPLSQIAALGAMVGYLTWNEPKRFPKQREFLLLLLLWVLFAVSTVFALSPEAALAKLILVSKIFLMIVLTLSIINTQERLNALIRVISFSLGFYAIKAAVFVVFSGGSFLVYGPENSFLAANNTIGLAFAMNVPLLVYLLRIETRPWLRWIIKTMIVCSYPGAICTYSRGAWLGLVMATALIVLRGQRKFLMVCAGAILAVVVISIKPLIMPQRLAVRYDTLVNYQEDSSAESRFWNWEFCRRVGTARPFTGAGFDYYSKSLYEVYYPEFLERWPNSYWSCHSTWLTVFGEHGFPGFLVWLGLVSSTVLSLRRIRVYSKRREEFAWAGHCAEMVQVALAAYLVVGTFLDAAYFDIFYYLVVIAIVLKERVFAVSSLSAKELMPAVPQLRARGTYPVS
jgi:putative inorganic carbon (HCO3(-)) transporter